MKIWGRRRSRSVMEKKQKKDEEVDVEEEKNKINYGEKT